MSSASSTSTTTSTSDSAFQASASRDTSGRSRLWRDLRTLPNLMSLSRIFIVCAAAVLYMQGFPITGLVLGFWCGVSDYLDGYIARRTGRETDLGSILDRLGDLVFEVMCFVFAIHVGGLSPYFFLVYIFRELVVMSTRQYVSEHLAPGTPMKSTIFGKLKTNFLGYSFLALFLLHAKVIPVWWINTFFEYATMAGICGGLAFSYISGYQYLTTFIRTYDEAAGDQAAAAQDARE